MVIYHGRTSKKSPTIQTQVGRLGDEPPGMSIKIQVSNLCQTTKKHERKTKRATKKTLLLSIILVGLGILIINNYG